MPAVEVKSTKSWRGYLSKFLLKLRPSQKSFSWNEMDDQYMQEAEMRNPWSELANEIIAASKGRRCMQLKRKMITHRMADANKAFVTSLDHN